MTDTTPKTPFTIRIDPTQLEALKETAWRKRTTPSDIVRQLIDAHLSDPTDYTDVT